MIPVLLQKSHLWIRRFNVYMTSLTHEPRGPIGQAEVDADTGNMLNDPRAIALIYEHGHILSVLTKALEQCSNDMKRLAPMCAGGR